MNNNTVATRHENKLQTLVKSEGIQSRFRDVLGKRTPQFCSSLIQVGNSLGDDCDPMSIISGAMIAATLDLPINRNLGFSWLIPFVNKGKKEALFIVGYKGLIQLAIRTGQYSRMNAGPVNIECFGGYDSVGEPKINFDNYDPEQPPSGYFFAFQMVNGFTKVAYWSKADVEAHAKRYSQSFRGGFNSPWKTNFDEMATKTVIANELRVWGIMSIEMQKAIEMDGAIVKGIDEVTTSFPDSPTGPIVEVSSPAPEPEQPVQEQDNDGGLGPVPNPEGGIMSDQPMPEPEKAPERPAPQPTQRPAAPPRTPLVKAPPARATAPAASTAGEATPQKELQLVIQNAKYGWDKFAQWAEGAGVIPDCTSLSSFDEIKTADAKRLLAAKRGVLNGIATTFPS